MPAAVSNLSPRFHWRAANAVVVFFKPNRETLNEWHAVKAGHPEEFRARTEDEVEQHVASYFKFPHWK